MTENDVAGVSVDGDDNNNNDDSMIYHVNNRFNKMNKIKPHSIRSAYLLTLIYKSEFIILKFKIH